MKTSYSSATDATGVITCIALSRRWTRFRMATGIVTNARTRPAERGIASFAGRDP